VIQAQKEITVRRRQVGRMVGCFRIDVVAARRLHCDRDIAAADRRDRELSEVEPAFAKKGSRSASPHCRVTACRTASGWLWKNIP
jgi:hypothetical protein